MAPYNQVYQQAYYYDIVFNRNVNQEVDFMQSIYQRYTGANLQSMLEIACGPGYHARAVAKRGLRAVGLDLRPEMINFARDQAMMEGANVTWLAADMRNFLLETPVDMAICIFDGLDALLTNADIIQHFRVVADNLTPKGIYLLEFTHPRENSYGGYGNFRYQGQQNGLAVDILWATNNPTFDPVTGIAQVEIEMRIKENGHTQIIHDSAQERFLSPQEIRLLAGRSGALRVVDWYGDFNLNQPLDNTPSSRRMIGILQKVGES